MIAIVLSCLLAITAFANQPDPRQQAARTVVVAEIRGTINPASANYLMTSLRIAEHENAEALIVELDTPGGLVSSVKEMAQTIDESKIPVVVYVAPAGASATSAGALLSFAAHLVAMTPGSHIGAAHPVDSGGNEIKGVMGQKILNDTTAFARGLAEIRGRDPKLVEAVVAKSRSFTAQEAKDEELIDFLSKTRAELLHQLDGRQIKLKSGELRTIRSADAAVHEAGMSWGQNLLHQLSNPNLATIFMTIGMLCIYVEITNPGVVMPGIVGAISLLIGFMSFQLIPIHTGALLLLVLGAALLLAEPFVTSHGALAVGGVVCFILGALWVVDPTQTDLRLSVAVWVPAALALGGGATLIALAAARTRKLSDRAIATMGGGGESGLRGYSGRVETVSADGLSGKAVFRGETWDFQCEIPVEVGDKVEVVRVVGMRAGVKRV